MKFHYIKSFAKTTKSFAKNKNKNYLKQVVQQVGWPTLMLTVDKQTVKKDVTICNTEFGKASC